MVSPLRKQKSDGSLYTRPSNIEAKISELALLSRDELISRCAIRQKDDPLYVPSECLLHFVRASRPERSNSSFEKLYKLLIDRIVRYVSAAESLNGQQTFLTSTIREEVVDRFADLIARDHREYVERLDFFEARFNKSLRNLYIDVQRQVGRNAKRETTLDDDITGEPKVEVERAAGNSDPFDLSDFSGEGYRFALNEAINSLPPLEQRIIEMTRLNFPVHSEDSSVMTISKALNKSEKTIRTHRKKAYAALHAALTAGETL